MVLCLFFTACQANSRTYVNHTEGPYSIADDTLILQNNLIINRSDFQKIRNGQRLPKQYQVKQWKRNSPDAPVIRIDGRHVYWNNTIYLRMP
jgi:glutaredoxin